MKVGIIGLGHGQRVLFESFKLSNIKILGVASKDQKKAEIFSKKNNIIKKYKNWKEIIKDNEIDIIAIAVPAVHQIIEAYDHQKFAEVANNADLALPDGRPVYWALKLLKHKDVEHLPGFYVTKKLCKFAAENDLKIGFYGGENKTLNKCISNLKKKFEKLTIGYAYSPPFRMLTNEEKKEIIDNINSSGIEILFVCLGCPKQEFWMAEHKDYLNAQA